MTLSEMAERIRGEGDDHAALVAKLKTWVKEGLIEAVGEKNPGTGNRRTYDEQALINAAVLHAVSSQAGMSATRAAGFSALFKASHSYFRRSTKDKYVAIAIKGRAAEIGTADAGQLSRHLAGSPYAAHVVVDLEKLFEHLERSG